MLIFVCGNAGDCPCRDIFTDAFSGIGPPIGELGVTMLAVGNAGMKLGLTTGEDCEFGEYSGAVFIATGDVGEIGRKFDA